MLYVMSKGKVKVIFMKTKLAITMILILSIISGCSFQQEKVENSIPVNDKAGAIEDSGNNRKNNSNDNDDANNELSQADENGVVSSIKKKEYTIDKTRTETIKGEAGEDVDVTFDSDEKLIFTISKETEIKVILYDTQTMKSRLTKGSQADIQNGSFVGLYGKMSGSKFIATKVIILKTT